MSDETKTQEQDAAFIAEMRESCRVIEKADRTYSYDEDYHIARDYFYANRNHLPFAALRTIDRQQAEIERLTAALNEMLSKYDAAGPMVMHATMIVEELQTQAILSPSDQITNGVLHAIQRLKPALGIASPTPVPAQPTPPTPTAQPSAPTPDAETDERPTAAQLARQITPFLHSLMTCGEAKDAFSREPDSMIQGQAERQTELALISWRDRDHDSAMMHLINAQAATNELIRRVVNEESVK